jgi:fructose-1,6-bisphosphatase/inositol monophosphatase family enzyme
MYGEDSSALGELRGCAYIPARYNDNAPGMDDSLESIFRYIHHPDIKDGRNYKIADVRPGSGSASLMACHVAEGRIHFQILYQQGAYDLLGFKIAEAAHREASAGFKDHEEGDINLITTAGLRRVNGAVYNKETTKRLVNTLLLHPEASTVDELTALME